MVNKLVSGIEVIKIWLLFALSIIVVYYLPAFVKYPYFLILLFFAYKSEKDYWWIAFFLITFAEIGGLFPQTSQFVGDFRRIPIYNLGPIRLPFYDLVVTMLFVKAFLKGKTQIYFKEILMLIAIYIIILYIISIILGMSVENHIDSIRAIYHFTLFYSLPRLLKSSEDWYKLFYILFSAIIMIVIFVLIEIITGFKIGSISGAEFKFTMESEEVRLIYSPFLVLMTFIMASFMFYSKDKRLNHNLYYSFIIFFDFILIILSATRGWFLAFSAILALNLLILQKKSNKLLAYVVPLIILVLAISTYIPQVGYVFDNVFGRISTIGKLAEGDLTLGGTVSRVTVRASRMLNKVVENPIIGFGFSNEYYQYADNHVGPVMQLLQMGIIGTLLIYIYIISYIKEVRNLVKQTNERAYYAFSTGLIGILIIHFTSTTIFSFSATGHPERIAELMAITFAILNCFILENKKKYIQI